MSETVEKNTNTFRRDSVKPYVELIDDGREYYVEDELQDLSLSLQCNSKSGVVLYGPTGCGKTALVRKFIQQDLKAMFGVESIKAFHIRPFWTIGRFDIETMLNIISNIVEESETKAVILHAEFSSLDLLNQALNVMDYYLDEIKIYYNLSMFKFIFELPVDDQKKREELFKSTQNNAYYICCKYEYNAERFLGTLTPRIDELSRKLGVTYSKNILPYFIAAFDGHCDNYNDFNNYIDFFEMLFVLSNSMGKKRLEKDIARKIYKETFEYLERNPKEVIKNTAIHESGHALLGLLNEQKGKLMYVSIIPGVTFNGVTCYESPKKVGSYYRDRNFFVKDIAKKLAGRVAEKIVNNNERLNAGASSDLKNAMQVINDVVTRFGFAEEIGKNYALLEGDRYISEETILSVEDERRNLLKDAEEYAERMISIHKEFVELLADKLIEERVVAQDELYEMWETYLKSKQ